MDAVTVAKLWLVIRPVQRIKAWRKRRQARKAMPVDQVPEDFNYQPDEDSSMNSAIGTQLVLALLRHAMTALAPLGIVVSDDWLVQTASLGIAVIGMAWSWTRKLKS